MLVGHSYGGAVISAAATGNDQVKALVYFNGWMPDEGESIGQLLEKFEGSLVGSAVRPVPFTGPDGAEGADLYLAAESFREAFAADVDSATADLMAAAQRPFTGAALGGPSGPPAWRSGVPCWYLLGTEDKAIPPALQRFMAERAHATIVEVPASHVSYVSQPEAATESSFRRPGPRHPRWPDHRDGRASAPSAPQRVVCDGHLLLGLQGDPHPHRPPFGPSWSSPGEDVLRRRPWRCAHSKR